MKKIGIEILCVFVGIMTTIMLLLTAVQIIGFNIPYYEWHYNKYDISEDTHMELDQLMYVTEEMLDYLNNKRDDLHMTAIIDGEEQEVFGERELLHMEDVQVLFFIGKWIRNITLILLSILFFVSYRLSKEFLGRLLVRIQQIIFGFLGTMVLIGLIVSINFNYFFTLFHKVFFTNDLWLLDPKTDILINMVPEQFFINTSILILIVFIFECLIMFQVIQLYRKKRLTT